MEKYYFKTRGQDPDVECTEMCMVRKNGTMIGSCSCQKCEFHKENNQDEDDNISWIKCSRIEEAMPEQPKE